jgi:hypothetical protein
LIFPIIVFEKKKKTTFPQPPATCLHLCCAQPQAAVRPPKSSPQRTFVNRTTKLFNTQISAAPTPPKKQTSSP